MEHEAKIRGFVVKAAERGGYFVSSADSAPGEYRFILFAGRLDECLTFIRAGIAGLDPEA